MSAAYEVILAINGLVDWSIHPISLDIKDFSSKFEEISFVHILRWLMQARWASTWQKKEMID